MSRHFGLSLVELWGVGCFFGCEERKARADFSWVLTECRYEATNLALGFILRSRYPSKSPNLFDCDWAQESLRAYFGANGYY